MDVFAAASVDFINELDQKGLILEDSKSVYARGRITLWTRKDSQLKVEKINDLASDDVKRIAIANPDHAPYGIAAREALQAAGIGTRSRKSWFTVTTLANASVCRDRKCRCSDCCVVVEQRERWEMDVDSCRAAQTNQPGIGCNQRDKGRANSTRVRGFHNGSRWTIDSCEVWIRVYKDHTAP